jgi:hypothetical protein
MAIKEIENFRAKYPQYNDIDDVTLANKLASKYSAYADLPEKVRYGSLSEGEKINTKLLPNLPQTEQKIQERGSQFQGLVDSAKELQQHPFKSLLNPFGPLSFIKNQSAIGNAAFGTAEAIPTSAALAIQRGEVSKIPTEAFKAVTGQRQAQFGDLIRTTGVGGRVGNELLASAAGLGGMAALTGGLSKGKTTKVIDSTAKEAGKQLKQKFTPPPEAYLKKAEKLTTEILQPSKQELSGYIARGEKMPAIEEAMTTIKKSKSYGELRGNIDKAISETMDFRNKILKENNRPIRNYTKHLEKYIDELKSKGQATPPEIQQMGDVLARENEFLRNNPLDRIGGQARKEYLQRLTDTLLQKSEKGLVIDTQPARTRALDLLRRGLREAVEGNNYKIAELNSRYGGLLKARELIAGQEALAQKALPQNLLSKIMRFITRPQDIPGEVARAALERNAGLSRKTGNIQKFVTKANAR